MLVRRNEIKDEETGRIMIESFFDSSNILKTLYIPDRDFMFIFFHNLVYSYNNVTEDLYVKFERADSQGKFFINEIKKNPKTYRHFREFKLYEFEKQGIRAIIEEAKNIESEGESNILP